MPSHAKKVQRVLLNTIADSISVQVAKQDAFQPPIPTPRDFVEALSLMQQFIAMPILRDLAGKNDKLLSSNNLVLNRARKVTYCALINISEHLAAQGYAEKNTCLDIGNRGWQENMSLWKTRIVYSGLNPEQLNSEIHLAQTLHQAAGIVQQNLVWGHYSNYAAVLSDRLKEIGSLIKSKLSNDYGIGQLTGDVSRVKQPMTYKEAIHSLQGELINNPIGYKASSKDLSYINCFSVELSRRYSLERYPEAVRIQNCVLMGSPEFVNSGQTQNSRILDRLCTIVSPILKPASEKKEGKLARIVQSQSNIKQALGVVEELTAVYPNAMLEIENKLDKNLAPSGRSI